MHEIGSPPSVSRRSHEVEPPPHSTMRRTKSQRHKELTSSYERDAKAQYPIKAYGNKTDQASNGGANGDNSRNAIEWERRPLARISLIRRTSGRAPRGLSGFALLRDFFRILLLFWTAVLCNDAEAEKIRQTGSPDGGCVLLSVISLFFLKRPLNDEMRRSSLPHLNFGVWNFKCDDLFHRRTLTGNKRTTRLKKIKTGGSKAQSQTAPK